MWYKCLSWTQGVWCEKGCRDICWLLVVTRPGMRTDDVDMQLVWRCQERASKCLLDNGWQPTTEFDNQKRSLDLQLHKLIFGKVKSFQTDKHCRQINWTEKGAKRPMIVLNQEEKKKHCCRCFCQNCEWHSKVVVRGEKNKKCIVPTTSTANKELCFTGFPQHWSVFADININRLSVKLPLQTRRYVY